MLDVGYRDGAPDDPRLARRGRISAEPIVRSPAAVVAGKRSMAMRSMLSADAHAPPRRASPAWRDDQR
jgi:hypothetical protein